MGFSFGFQCSVADYSVDEKEEFSQTFSLQER